jgi:hypothetical protein
MSSCRPDVLPAIPCDTTTVVLHDQAVRPSATGLQLGRLRERQVPDTLHFLGTYSIRWNEEAFGKDWIYLKVKHRGRLDSITPVSLLVGQWGLNKPLLPEAQPIKRCYDSILAHFPRAN